MRAGGPGPGRGQGKRRCRRQKKNEEQRSGSLEVAAWSHRIYAGFGAAAGPLVRDSGFG